MLDGFRLLNSRSWDIIYSLRYLKDLRAESGGQDGIETLKSILRTYDHFGGVFTERSIMVEYERTAMLLCVLPKQLWRMASTMRRLNPLERCTFHYRQCKCWVAARIVAAVAVTMLYFVAPAPPPMTTFPALAISPASTASPTSIAAPVPLAPTA